MNTCLVVSKDGDRNLFVSNINRHLSTLGIRVVDNAEQADFTIILGGDGTVLGAARDGLRSPVICVNTGHLGFLSSCSATAVASAFDVAIQTIERVLLGEFTVTTRPLLSAAIRNDHIGGQEFLALNDAAIRPLNVTKLVRLDLYGTEENGEEVLIATYRADGLIVASPTGSTAYSLSAGGPIIHPSCKSFCVTPICPQGLTQRPLVLPHGTLLRIEPQENDLYLSIDGQIGHPVEKDAAIFVSYNTHSIQTVNPIHSYYQTLQMKLGWGIHPTLVLSASESALK